MSFTQLFHLLGLQAFHHPVRRPVLSHEAAIRLLSCDSVFPSGVIERRRIPARLFQAGIVMLALINHVADDGTARHFPRRVADDDFLPPVRIFQMQLEQQTRRTIALYPILFGIVETVAQNHTQCIVALLQPVGQIIRQIHDFISGEVIFHLDGPLHQSVSPVIIGLVRNQHFIAHLLTVQAKFIISQTRNPDTGGLQPFRHLESLAQQRSRRRSLVFHFIQSRFALPGHTYPLGSPFFFRQSGYPYGRLAPIGCIAVLVPHLHAPPTFLAGSQRAASISYTQGL